MLGHVLQFHRETLLHKMSGLDGEQLARRAVPPSSLSLLGLVRHLAKVERIWFRDRVGGEEIAALHGGAGDPEDFRDLDPSTAPAAYGALVEEMRAATSTMAGRDLDSTIDVKGEPMSLRLVMLHVIGEYARHNGHADLLRECIDGTTGA